MIRTLISFLFFALGWQTVSAVEAYRGSRIFWDTATRTTVFNGGGYARIIELQDGRLMAVCESGGIKIAFSQNKGSTWSSATKIVNNPGGISEAVPDLIQLKDGTIIVAYNPRPNEPYSEERKFGIRCKRSTDNGKTWSDEIFVNDASHTYTDGCWEPSMLELPSGELQLYFADEGPYTMNGDQQISLCRSFDGGQSWSAPQKICYREGCRDGMPVPVLLKDQQEIVVVIEDNGWGYGDFFPTTVRTSLENNWNNYWVDGGDANREKTLNLNYSPLATGGAPYLRVLPWGETVMSYQSSYDHNGKLRMRVAVGNEQARDFKAVSVPFSIGDNEEGLWNSLAVIDTGIVVAVSGIAGNIEMIKGYPVRQLQAPYGKPAVDGKITANEGYYTRAATQILLGSQTGTRVAADMAYDMDSLYFVARVSDRTQVTSGANADCLTLLIDASEKVEASPQQGCFKLMIRPDGSFFRMQVGQNNGWKSADKALMPLRTAASQTSTYYVVEMAIPWSALGFDQCPTNHRFAFALECSDYRSGTVYTETIPDAQQMNPNTWMPLHLGALPEDVQAVREVKMLPAKRMLTAKTYDMGGRRTMTPYAQIVINNGKKYFVR